MASDLPWFSMYPTDFLVSTAMLTPVQGWAYTQMLMYAWTNGGIPDDREGCQAMTRCQLTEADWAVLRARFEVRVAQATLPATLVHPRMEAEREKARSRHTAAVEAGRRGAEARSGAKNKGGLSNPSRVAQATLPAESKGGSSNPSRVASATTTTTTTTEQSPPKPPKATDGGGGNWKWRREDLRRLAMRDPAWRTRIERAQAGDWYEVVDGQRVAVNPLNIEDQAVAAAYTKHEADRVVVMERVVSCGLTDGEAARLFARWYDEHLNGGPTPLVAMRNDVNDKSVRNIAAVWRARLAGPYNPSHGATPQSGEAGAAGGSG